MRWFAAVLGLGLAVSGARGAWFKTEYKLLSPSRDFTEAKIILVAKVVRSTSMKDGTGTSDLEIVRVLRGHPLIPKGPFTTDYYLEVNPKVELLLFCDVYKEILDPYKGYFIPQGSAVPKFVMGAPAWKDQATPRENAARLPYFFEYFEHAESDIARDAFAEWVELESATIAMGARQLPPGSAAKLRNWLKNPKTPGYKVGLYAFLLGFVSDQPANDAVLIRSFIEIDLIPSDRVAYPALMAGYLRLAPFEKTWDWYRSLATDPENSFARRHSVLLFLRYQEPLAPLETRRRALDLLAPWLDQQDTCDLVVEQFRRWELWTHTDKILTTYGTPIGQMAHNKRAIVAYALACPQPACRRFIANLRKQDPELVADVEELWKLEKTALPGN